MKEHTWGHLVPIEELIPLINEQLKKGGNVSFTPLGVSMYPMLRHGIDTVVLSPLPKKLSKYDLVLYQRDNGRYVLHRIVKLSTDYTCIGDNQYYYEQGVRRNQLIAVVSSFTRGGKKYTVNDLSYKIYCRLWHHSRWIRRVLRAIKHRIIKPVQGGSDDK